MACSSPSSSSQWCANGPPWSVRNSNMTGWSESSSSSLNSTSVRDGIFEADKKQLTIPSPQGPELLCKKGFERSGARKRSSTLTDQRRVETSCPIAGCNAHNSHRQASNVDRRLNGSE